jgi:hypothetical protein
MPARRACGLLLLAGLAAGCDADHVVGRVAARGGPPEAGPAAAVDAGPGAGPGPAVEGGAAADARGGAADPGAALVCPPAGRATLLATAQDEYDLWRHLVVDDEAAYFSAVWSTDGGDASLLRVPLEGGVPLRLARPGGPDFHMVDIVGDDVYYTASRGGLQRKPKRDANAAATVVVPSFVGSIAVHDGHVYGSTDDSVFRIPLGGGPVQALAAAQDQPRVVASDGARVYWTTQERGYIVKSAPAAGGGPSDRVVAGDELAHHIAFDEGSFFWSTRHDRGRELWTARAAGGEPRPLVTFASTVGALAVDARHVYFAAAPAEGETGPRGLFRIPKGGGTVEAIACGAAVSSVALGPAHAYWTERGRLLRASK